MPEDIEFFSFKRRTLESLLEFYTAIKAADAIFKPCQDKSFRQQVKAIAEAKNIEKAYSLIEEMLRKEGN